MEISNEDIDGDSDKKNSNSYIHICHQTHSGC